MLGAARTQGRRLSGGVDTIAGMYLTSPTDVEGATASAERTVEIHRRLVDWLKPGQTLADVDTFVGNTLAELDSTSAFLGYRAKPHPRFPSHACLSLNECVVHGTHDMTRTPIKEGDLLSIDVGVLHDGWIGDAAWTYGITEVEPIALALMQAGRNSLAAGIKAMQPGRPLLDWARAVQKHAEEECGFKLIRGLGGHGYGKTLHGPPFISNVVPRHAAEWSDAFNSFKPGLLVAVEPMLSLTTDAVRSEGRDWPLFSEDDSLSVHYESDILITPEGPLNLTAGLFDLPDLVGT